MSTEGWRVKEGHVAKAAELAQMRLEGPEAARVAGFIAAYYEDADPDDIVQKPVEDLFAQALSMWRFSDTRTPGTAKLRVYNPTLEEHGWQSKHTVIECVNDDMPFLVDSITAELTQRGRDIFEVIHPILLTARDDEGKRLDQEDESRMVRESAMFLEIDEQSDAESLAQIEECLRDVFNKVSAAVEDWQAILGQLNTTIRGLRENPPPISPEELEEAVEFLHWLGDDHFTFLGYREYAYSGDVDHRQSYSEPTSGLGILRDPEYHVLRGEEGMTALSAEIANFLDLPEPLIIMKANRRSVVHRPVHMDYIGVKRFDADGNVVGECRFVGLFTSVAYSRSARVIPVLRRKVAQTIARAGYDGDTHNGKTLINVLESFPRDELFQINSSQLVSTALGIMRLQERPRPKAFLRFDNFERFVSALVFVPKENYETSLRIKIQEILARAVDGTVSTQFTEIGTSSLARLHIIIRTEPGAVPAVDINEIDRQIIDATRSWRDNLREHLGERFGEAKGNRFAARYADGFSVAYREEYSPALAAIDIEKLETLEDEHGLAFNIYRNITDDEDVVRLKIYHASSLIPLSECLPKLENLGLRVIEEDAFSVKRAGADALCWVHDFLMRDSDHGEIGLTGLKDRLERTLARIWGGEVEDDSLNALVVSAGLEAGQVVILRACIKYLRQAEITFSQSYMRLTLLNNPSIAANLVDLFECRFNIDAAGEAGSPEAIETAISAQLETVSSLDEDRILRRVLNLVQSMLRTNYYQSGENGAAKSYLSFKLDSKNIEELPLPRPHVEIFVYSPRVEGVHLRGGKVARGGLRWSDRPEDFRTEVLGLVKAQMVKNAVIVPVGAKGGFVPKQMPSGGDREAVLEEGIACYKIFISGLLDLTDNLVEGKIVPPIDVLRRDDDDPYLVVAADKGTAAFSDIANEISEAYGFWMGDAFASGGTYGYDHKNMGITARGAWVCVQRHFRELGVNVQEDPVKTIGIGDMSGDVFGNGMLCSRTIKLVAAFDHRHIFIDPDPEMEASFIERERLFALPRSSWADYDAKLISRGGGVFERTAKSVTISDEAKKLLGIEDEKLTPNMLIKAILTSKADLLWNGGIGTYFKSADETDADVGDRANDGVRIDGRELHVKVVGEGGNLAFTQWGRIEFAAKGGRINTDAVDNSGGVDCSDHEVNIKILLGAVVAAGDMTVKQRNKLLEEMTDEVSELVLAANYRQAELLSSTQARAPELLESQARFMRALERQDLLDRQIEFLPTEEELSERLSAGQGLTRPELAVLMSYAKMALFGRLMDSDVPDDPWLRRELHTYFPQPLQERFAEAIDQHRLKREIVATVIANDVINRAGISYVTRVAEETGATVDQIVRAYVIAREVLALTSIWDEIDALDNVVPAEVQTEMLLDAKELLHRKARWFLTHLPLPLDLTKTIDDFAQGAQSILDDPEKALTDSEIVLFGYRRSNLEKAGIPAELATRVAAFGPMASASDIVLVANQTKRTSGDVARAYFAVGEQIGLDELRAASVQIVCDNHWDRLAVRSIVDDLYDLQRDYTASVLSNGLEGCEAVDAWVEEHAGGVDRAAALLNEVKASGTMTLAKLGYVSRHVRSLFSV